jgi:transportin-3
VAALAVHVPAEDWGDGGIVKWLRDEMDSNPEYIPGFLELLTVLPEVYTLTFQELGPSFDLINDTNV